MTNFNWKTFHKWLDTASATMMQERIDEKLEYGPSKISLIEFMRFSHKKSLEEKMTEGTAEKAWEDFKHSFEDEELYNLSENDKAMIISTLKPGFVLGFEHAIRRWGTCPGCKTQREIGKYIREHHRPLRHLKEEELKNGTEKKA